MPNFTHVTNNNCHLNPFPIRRGLVVFVHQQVFAPLAFIGAKWSLTICVFAPLASYPPPAAAFDWGASPGRADDPDSFTKKEGWGVDLHQVSITLPPDNPGFLDAHRDLYPFAHMTLEAQE